MAVASRNKEIENAYKIAVDDLRKNYGEQGIYAGPRNHHEYWARDAFFASYGSLSLREISIVKRNLELFTRYQKPNGHIPLRVEDRFHGPGLLGINIMHTRLKAIYYPSQPWAGEVIDSNPLYLIALSEYVQQSGDTGFIRTNKKNIMGAVNWLVGKFNQLNLVTEGFNAGWADFTFKRGNVLYTNILVWKAFQVLTQVLPKDGANYSLILTKQMEQAIVKHLWDKKKGYFIDHIGKSGVKHDVFTSDGNLLAIFYGFANQEKSEKIMKFIDKNNLNKIPVPIYFPHLEWKHKIPNNFFFPSYNTENTFTWWGSISAVCRMKLGDTEGAINDLHSLSEIILKYKTVPEIVNPQGKLVRTFLYRTEVASSWAAGMFVYAYNFAKKQGVL